MSSTWNFIGDITVASLPQPDVEALQVNTLPLLGVVPPPYLANRGDNLDEIAIMFRAYTAGVIASTTVDFQIIEVSPDPETRLSSPSQKIYIGRTPVTAHPTGRIHIFPARYLHAFLVRVSAAAAGDALKAYWRPYR